ncbi:putative fatty-acid amide hydrolase [Diaporthe sp. PMI_573]|nr:putative fatty-acid amide hydrolase [Diaporthaceae sp. PMI_573]
MAAPDDPATANWRQIGSRKQHEREKVVSEWSQKLLGTPKPRIPPAHTVSVRDWAAQSGHLDTKQLEITTSVPSRLLEKMAVGIWTAEEVLVAFIIRATIAHHLTNPLSDVFFEKGLTRARELDAQLRRTGRPVGPLHGLPLSLKDLMNLEGHATTFGFVALADNIKSESDPVVARLHDAGAVFYCKTNVPQSTMSGECNNFLYGRTSTPDNRNLSAGGSSGGEGSLIALKGSPLGIGTDIAGSIRTPANFNGVYGLCPTSGRLPCHSAKESSLEYITGVAGPISSSIDGLEVYVKSLLSLRPWEWDATCLQKPWDDRHYQETRSRKLCFGFVAHDGMVQPHPPIRRGMQAVREALQKANHEVVDIDILRASDGLWDTAVRVFCADGGEELRNILAMVPEPPIPEITIPPASMALTATQLSSLGKKLIKVRQDFLERWQATSEITGTGRPVDVCILPSGGHVAPPHGTMTYFLYEAISNIIDWPCATIPVNNVDATLDPKPGPDEDIKPLSKEDQENYDKYSPEAYENGAVCLQVLGPRHSEEMVLAALRVMDSALGRGKDHIQ